MSIRIRALNGKLIAICAARSVSKEGDIYLDDAAHHALAEKFMEDFQSEGYDIQCFDLDAALLRQQEESNNPAREWWDRTYKPIRSSMKASSLSSKGDA